MTLEQIIIRILAYLLGAVSAVFIVTLISVCVFRFMDEPEEFPKFNAMLQLFKRNLKL